MSLTSSFASQGSYAANTAGTFTISLNGLRATHSTVVLAISERSGQPSTTPWISGATISGASMSARYYIGTSSTINNIAMSIFHFTNIGATAGVSISVHNRAIQGIIGGNFGYTVREIVSTTRDTIWYGSETQVLRGSGTLPQLTSNSVTQSNILLAAGALRGVAGNSFVADTDTKNGSWSAMSASGNSTAGGCGSQIKLVNATGTQSWDFYGATTAPYTAFTLIYQEVSLPASAYTKCTFINLF
jgi:hypothetical protein